MAYPSKTSKQPNQDLHSVDLPPCYPLAWSIHSSSGPFWESRMVTVVAGELQDLASGESVPPFLLRNVFVWLTLMDVPKNWDCRFQKFLSGPGTLSCNSTSPSNPNFSLNNTFLLILRIKILEIIFLNIFLLFLKIWVYFREHYESPSFVDWLNSVLSLWLNLMHDFILFQSIL